MSDAITLTADEAAIWLAERQPSGFLVALWVNPDTAAELAVPNGEPADALHITLAYCGDASEMDDLAVYRTIAAIERAVQWWGSVEGTVSGYGRFNPSDSSDDQSVFYASVDILGLTELRQRIIDTLYEVGVSVLSEQRDVLQYSHETANNSGIGPKDVSGNDAIGRLHDLSSQSVADSTTTQNIGQADSRESSGLPRVQGGDTSGVSRSSSLQAAPLYESGSSRIAREGGTRVPAFAPQDTLHQGTSLYRQSQGDRMEYLPGMQSSPYGEVSRQTESASAVTLATQRHGWVPHITLAYLPADAPNPVESVPPVKLTFDGVTVMVGSKRVDIPFAPGGGVVSMADAPAELPANAPLDTLLARPLLFEATQEWIAFLPKPGKYHHSIFDLDLTAEKYDRLVGNFKANTYGQDLPINVEHDFRAAGAVGWITDMRIATDGSIEVKPDWNERGKALLEGDRFRYVSAEWADKWQDPVSGEFHTDVPMGLAICTHPHLKPNVLKPLAMSEEAALVTFSSAGDPGSTEVAAMADEPQVTQETVTDTTTAAPAVTTPVQQRTVDDLSLTEIVMSADARRKEREYVATLVERAELAERRATTAETALTEARRQNLEEWAKAEVMGFSADNGTKWYGSPQENIEWLLSEAVTYGKDSPNVNRLLRHKRGEARAVKADTEGLFDPMSAAAEPARDVRHQVQHLAESKQRTNPVLYPTYELAERAVYDENPDLYLRELNAKK